MARYRYRTPALAGPWRDSREAALRDAVAANQARHDPDSPSGVKWLVAGDIEEQESDPPLRAGAGR